MWAQWEMPQGLANQPFFRDVGCSCRLWVFPLGFCLLSSFPLSSMNLCGTWSCGLLWLYIRFPRADTWEWNC